MAMQFWKDKQKKLIDPDLFSAIPERLARQVHQEKTRTVNQPTQIRKFFDEVVRFDTIIKANPDEFEATLPYLKMLNAKVAYAMGRDLVSPGFKELIADGLSQVNDKDDFRAFAGMFEAFMGYYKFFDKKGDRNHR